MGTLQEEYSIPEREGGIEKPTSLTPMYSKGLRQHAPDIRPAQFRSKTRRKRFSRCSRLLLFTVYDQRLTLKPVYRVKYLSDAICRCFTQESVAVP